MAPSTIALLLAAALLHASWNAVLRGGSDRLASITIMTATGTTVALPFLFWLPAPPPGAWPFLALSTTLQVGYCLFLVRAYRDGGLAQVYPIARGSSPVLVASGAALFVDERLDAMALGGVLLVSVGIVGLALGRGRIDPRSLGAALMTGVLIASYTVTDGIGARTSGLPSSYAAWLFASHGAAMVAVYVALRGRPALDVASRDTWKNVGGGVMAVGAYGIVLWALSIAPMGTTSALRETSVLFAAILGRVLLREPLGPARVASCIAIAAGAVCLGLR